MNITPGKWTVERYAEKPGAPTSEDRFGIFANGTQVCMAKFPSFQEAAWATEALFNFRLIAAAPDMREALRKIDAYSQRQINANTDEMALWLQVQNYARAALEGGTDEASL